MNELRPIQTPDYEEMLTDVRHAYRIVAAYQQKLFFTLRQIGAGFPELEFSYWHPAWNNRPPSPKTKPWERWNWDFLPLHTADYWFVRSGSDMNAKLADRDWFMTVRITADSGFDGKGKTTTSFSGPDPMLMDPAEKTWTAIYLNIYQVTKKVGAGHVPHEIWHMDIEDRDEVAWSNLPNVGARCITFGGPLASYLDKGAMERLIAEIRTHLTQDGLLVNPSK